MNSIAEAELRTRRIWKKKRKMCGEDIEEEEGKRDAHSRKKGEC